MKKSILFLLAFCMAFTIADAQKKSEEVPVPPSLPIDSVTKLIAYEEVIEVKGKSADEIYKRILEWFNTFYTNPTDVIRDKNETAHKIVGKPRFKIFNPPDKQGNKADGGLVQYTITVAAREGRYKVEITEYNWKQTSYFASEKWYDTKIPTWNNNYYEYLKQVDVYSKDVLVKLKAAVTQEKPVKDRDNW